jgi:hypothetical protein
VTAVTAETVELYRRYKSLALAASAAVILGERLDDIADAVDELSREAIGTPCAEPLHKLRQLVDSERAGGSTEADVEQVRSSHRSFRREVWLIQPCEYVPCCAGGAHGRR